MRREVPASLVQTPFAPPAGSRAIAIESASERFAFGTAEQKMPNVQIPPMCTGLGSSGVETTRGVVVYTARPAAVVAVAPVIWENPTNQWSAGSFGRGESVR